MLAKKPSDRITAQQCLEHPWFNNNNIDPNHAGHDDQLQESDKAMVLRRIKNFRAPKKLQVEALCFLVN